MATFISRRLLGLVPLLLGVTAILYFIMYLSPGGPATALASSVRAIPPAQLAAYTRQLGLDQPFYVQYVRWLGNLVIHGNLGYSYVDGQPVVQKILEKLPVTLELVGLGFGLTLLIAIPTAVYCATRKYSIIDYTATFVAFVGYGAPTYWLAIVLIEFFAVQHHLLPASGLSDIGASSFDFGSHVRHLILPVSTLTFVGMASWLRYQRAAMLDVLDEDYIRTAAAKGLSGWTIIVKHALRNALLPVITLVGLFLPALIVGAYFTEYVFSIPGMGYLGIHAIFQRDYPTIMGITLFAALFVAVGNLLADIGYALADPRIRYA